jgi:YHS domain-containing protein
LIVLTGGCQCGFLRYEASGVPFKETLCHCSLCRGTTGAPAVAWFSVRPRDFRFTEGKPTVGSEKFALAHGGATYRFSSQANLDLFKASPDKYLPQYGGYCAFGAFVGKKFDGDPTLWKIVDGKLYFNLNPTIAAKWLEETAAKIKVADENWTKIQHKAPADIK